MRATPKRAAGVGAYRGVGALVAARGEADSGRAGTGTGSRSWCGGELCGSGAGGGDDTHGGLVSLPEL